MRFQNKIASVYGNSERLIIFLRRHVLTVCLKEAAFDQCRVSGCKEKGSVD